VPEKSEFRERIYLHYSVYKDYENIIPVKKIKYVDNFSWEKSLQKANGVKSFFIGQPFSEYCDECFINSLISFLTSVNLNFYVKHPREGRSLIDSIAVLEKDGLIAEEAIYKACNGMRPVIYGGFSSVMFNIPASIADKVMMLSANDPKHQYYAELGKNAGCRIVFL
jgi:hypothetical protein